MNNTKIRIRKSEFDETDRYTLDNITVIDDPEYYEFEIDADFLSNHPDILSLIESGHLKEAVLAVIKMG